ncbi:MAG TPA: Na+/H+ antiporter [Thermoleophilaceae bacterium]
MAKIELFIALLTAVVLLAALARRLPVPHPIVLVLGGLGLGFVPGAPNIRLDPNVVFFVFLPPLVYAAGFLSSSEELQANARSVFLLATGLVLMTMAGIAVVAHELTGISWGAAFVLGAVLGPTDPIAATAVAGRLGAPQRLSTILQGEALVNDGTGLAVFKIAVGVTLAGSFSLASSVGEFFKISAGGIAVGLGVAFITGRVRRRIDEPELEVTTSLITAYAAYLVADRLGLSGVLASVAAGLYVSRSASELLGPATRIESYSFWEVTTFILESLLFLLVGLEFPTLVSDLEGLSAGTLVGYAAALTGAAILLRFAWMFTVPYLTSFIDERRGRGRSRLSSRERAVLGWSGMRGGVSLAAALSIPLATATGASFPDRPLVILLAYTTVIGTLVPTGLTLPFLIQKLGLARPEAARARNLEARRRLVEAALARASELEDEEELPERAVERAREIYDLRLRRLRTRLGAEEDGDGQEDPDAYRRVRREMLRAERGELSKLRRERKVPGELAREIERDLDYEESRLTG